MLELRWHCDACHMGNAPWYVSSETHFFAVILTAKRDHERISPSCEWGPMKIHGWLFNSKDSRRDERTSSQPRTLSSDADR